jgi:hypothetical protein
MNMMFFFIFWGGDSLYLFIYFLSCESFLEICFSGKSYVLFSIKLGFKAKKKKLPLFLKKLIEKNSHSISPKKLLNMEQIFLFNFIGPLTMLPTRRALKPCSQQSSPFKPSEIYHSYFKLVISKIQ